MSQVSDLAESSGIALKTPVKIVALDPRPEERVESTRSHLRHLELAAALAMHIEALPLLQGFFSQIQTFLPVVGFDYQSDALDLGISHGESSLYKATYNLSDNGVELGEITFFQEARFNSVSLCELEDMLCTLIAPLRNAHKYELAVQSAYRDPLTGLGNRNGLEAALPREIDLARRHGRSMAVIVMDVDGLKSVNDTHGHDIGDRVLRAVGEVIRGAIRATDMVYRYGGDEFVGALLETDMQGASDVCERIRHGVADISGDDGFNARVQMSIGLTMVSEADDFDSIFKRADAAMYTAKKSGRNRVVRC